MVKVQDAGNVSLHLADLQVLLEKQTTHYELGIYRHPQLGRVLLLNGEIQHVEAWTPLYHEPLVHLPAAFVERPQTALLIGGGSFFAARELLRYRSIKRVLMVDHDSLLLDVITDLYEHAVEVRNDPRLEVLTVDAFGALTKFSERFDLVINDSVDLVRTQGPDIFVSMARLLQPGGVCSDVVYRHIFDDLCLSKSIQFLRSLYRTAWALVFAPEYPGILHLLTMWSSGRNLRQTLRKTVNREQRAWARAPNANPCKYFDARFLQYYLHLPRCVREQLNEPVST